MHELHLRAVSRKTVTRVYQSWRLDANFKLHAENCKSISINCVDLRSVTNLADKYRPYKPILMEKVFRSFA